MCINEQHYFVEFHVTVRNVQAVARTACNSTEIAQLLTTISRSIEVGLSAE